MIDKTKSIKDQAFQAYSLRNKYKAEARLMMNDREAAEALNKADKNLSFDELVQNKMKRKNLTKEQAYKDVINTAGKTNKKVNERLNLEQLVISMNTYDVCNQTDEVIFKKCLEKLKKIEEFSLVSDVLEDVDGSLIAIFAYKGTEITLKNDEQVGTLYIDSEKDISHLIYDQALFSVKE